MSIRTFNKVMSSKGCIPVMSLVLLITMVMSFAGRGCAGQRGQSDEPGTAGEVVATIGSFQIGSAQIQLDYEGMLQRMQSSAPVQARTINRLSNANR